MAVRRKLDPETLGDHVDRLLRAARGLCGSREEAEDLVQDTFAAVLRRPRFLRSEDDIGYLLRVLRNTYVSGKRTSARRPTTTALPEGVEYEDRTSPTPESHLEHRELYAAIAALPLEFREAVIAVDVVGLSYGEASRALGVPEATITTRLYRGRQRLVRALRGSGIGPATPGGRSEPGARAPGS
jgi:RNA polymerase sigma-70 factor (ECF subfamily)